MTLLEVLGEDHHHHHHPSPPPRRRTAAAAAPSMKIRLQPTTSEH
jgi:hypothetical protein